MPSLVVTGFRIIRVDSVSSASIAPSAIARSSRIRQPGSAASVMLTSDQLPNASLTVPLVDEQVIEGHNKPYIVHRTEETRLVAPVEEQRRREFVRRLVVLRRRQRRADAARRAVQMLSVW